MNFKFLYRFSIWAVFVTLFFAACKEEQELPMEKDKAVKILTDIHIAEAALKPLSGSDKDKAAALIYQQIRSIHEVDQATIDTLLSYLKRNPEEMERVYEEVMVEFEKLALEKE